MTEYVQLGLIALFGIGIGWHLRSIVARHRGEDFR